MEIYLDANATTPVLPQARQAALAVMEESFGNPSSLHGSGLRARAILDGARTSARRALGVPDGRLLFTSGATEGIQTAVLSALTELRRRREGGDPTPFQLLYGATEHKAVPEALKHWNEVLGLGLPVRAIPVGRDGRHDLDWLREQVPTAGLVCTMAANNETGVISDLDGIARLLAESRALWMVDSVQALGKLPLDLQRRRIDYAPFSGHKLYAPKGIGMLYVRDGAPFTPLIMGGGQEGRLRSGTENMAGIAALGEVLRALDDGRTFQDRTTLAVHRQRLESALVEAFDGLVFNAPGELCLPTTLNFSVPGQSARLLLDLFDAAGLRVSGGSACGSAKAAPSDVLTAMGLPAWQCASAVRLSFGAADATELIDRACARIRACGSSLRASCQTSTPGGQAGPVEPLTRFAVDGACCYLIADASSARCVVVDPLPGLTAALSRWIACRGFTLAAVLDTGAHGEHTASAAALMPAGVQGWPEGSDQLTLGTLRLMRMPAGGPADGAMAYLLWEGDALRAALIGDIAPPRAEPPEAGAEPQRAAALLADAVGPHTLLLPAHDPEQRFATTLSAERSTCPLPAAGVELTATALKQLLAAAPGAVLVDVREPYEQMFGNGLRFELGVEAVQVPLSGLLNALPGWLALPAASPLVFYCRSGNRSAQAARALRRLGHEQAWSLGGGLSLWPGC